MGKQLPFFLSKSCDFNLKMDVYKKMFSSVDNGNSGEITIDQLKNSIEKSAEKDFVLFMNEEISRLKSDNIKLESYQDLVEKFMVRKLWRNLFMTDQGTDECMKILFPLIDKDGDGEVNKVEFTKLLKKLNDEEDEFKAENKDAGEAFDKLDVDGSGSISFDELIHAFKNGKF